MPLMHITLIMIIIVILIITIILIYIYIYIYIYVYIVLDKGSMVILDLLLYACINICPNAHIQIIMKNYSLSKNYFFSLFCSESRLL